MSQLITITPKGEIVTLQTKKGKGADMRKCGQASIARSSLIEWVEQKQMWFIVLLKINRTVTTQFLDSMGLSDIQEDLAADDTDRQGSVTLLYWNEYEDAVKAEVKLIQAIRLKHGVAAV